MKPNQLDLFLNSQIRATAVGRPDKLLMDDGFIHTNRARPSNVAYLSESGDLVKRSCSICEDNFLDSNALVRWKSDIATHQQQVRESKSAFQGTLFNLAPAQNDPDAIDPFRLTLQSMAFWRFPADSKGSACIYFIIDSAAELLLYIGETCRSNLRWKGEHDCKRYIANYQDLHYRHGLKTAVNMAFWWNVPMKTRPRQQMEAALVAKWKSPFKHLF